jgi:chromosomal replication initiation ATPase DnaA
MSFSEKRRAQLQDEAMFSQYRRSNSDDPLWQEFAFVGSSGILVPLAKKPDIASLLQSIQREQFLKQLASPAYQQDLLDFLNSDRFKVLRMKLPAQSKSNEHGASREIHKDDDEGDADNELQPLSDPKEFRVPQSSEAFLSLLDKCMSDEDDHLSVHHGRMRLFTAKSISKFIQEIGEDSERIARAWRMFVSIAKLNGFRNSIKPNQILHEKLSQLRTQFPNFSHVIDHISGQTRVWQLKREEEWRIKPILLNGPKGTGKSAFAKALADAFDTQYNYVNIASTSMSGILTGTSNKWGNGQPGLIFSALARDTSASPLILLDEIEKTDRGNHYPIEGALLALLEPQTSRTFCDEYGNLEFDASRVIYVATSNDSSLISDPLKSRFDVFNISYPNRNQREKIIINMLNKFFVNTRLSPAAMTLMASQDLDLRNLQSLLDKVVRQHVDSVLEQMASNGVASSAGVTVQHTNPMGYKHSLHGEQIIDEHTVKVCLENWGCKANAYFGFVQV